MQQEQVAKRNFSWIAELGTS